MQLDVARHARVYAYTGARAFDPRAAHVVFVHGAANDHSVWALQSRYFAHHGIQRAGARSARPRPLRRARRCDPSRRSPTGSCATARRGRSARARRSSGIRWARSPCSNARRAHPGARAPNRAARPGGADAGERRRCSTAATRDDHVAYELINGWSHSAAASSSAAIAVPGVWMTGSATASDGAHAPGVLAHRPCRLQSYADGLAAAASVRCPALVVARRARHHGAAEERRRDVRGARRVRAR